MHLITMVWAEIYFGCATYFGSTSCATDFGSVWSQI